MLKLKKRNEIPEGYDYYKEVQKKVKKISKEIFKNNNNEILEQKLYNLVINLCNQVIYDYKYVFTKDDLFFIVDYNINIHFVLEYFKEDIIKMRLSLK